MTQYMLSVHHRRGRRRRCSARPRRRSSRCSRPSTRFNEKVRGAGRLGVRRRPRAHARPRPPSTTPAPSRSSPTARSPSPRSGSAASGSSRRPTSTPRSSGPPRARRPAGARSRSGRSRASDASDRDPSPTGRSSGSTARSTAGSSPRWSAASATSTSPRRRPARRCWPPWRGGRVDGVPPNPGGWLTTTAGNRAIDRIRRESHRDAKHQAALMIDDDTPHEPTGIGRGRPAAADLHLLPPGARAGGAGGADAAAARRADRGRDRAGVPRPGDHDGAADHPREEEDQRRRRSPTGCPRPRTSPSGSRGVLAVLFLVFNEGYLSTSATATRSATSSPPRRSGWPGSCARCCPTSPRSPACSR